MTTPPTTAPSPPKGPSPFDAAQEAAAYTGRVLFPFRFETWFVLGFLAFLDECGRGGGGNFRLPFPGGGGTPGGGNWGGGGSPGFRDLGPATAWVGAHILLLVGITALVLTLVVGLTALVMWVNCRGIFMYMDAVATGRPDLGRSWKEHAERAGSLFVWRFAIALGSLVGILLLVLVVGAAVLGAARADTAFSSVGAVVLVAGLGLLFLFLVVALGLVSIALRDFVAPIQLARGLPCGDAFRVFVGLLKAHVWVFVLYVLLKIVFHLAFGIVAVFACCVTCCCATLPVVAQTVLQPALFFERAWSLYLLQQMGFTLPGGPLPAPTPRPPAGMVGSPVSVQG